MWKRKKRVMTGELIIHDEKNTLPKKSEEPEQDIATSRLSKRKSSLGAVNLTRWPWRNKLETKRIDSMTEVVKSSTSLVDAATEHRQSVANFHDTAEVVRQGRLRRGNETADLVIEARGKKTEEEIAQIERENRLEEARLRQDKLKREREEREDKEEVNRIKKEMNKAKLEQDRYEQDEDFRARRNKKPPPPKPEDTRTPAEKKTEVFMKKTETIGVKEEVRAKRLKQLEEAYKRELGDIEELLEEGGITEEQAEGMKKTARENKTSKLRELNKILARAR
jgi:hypothetical protein